MSVTVLSGLSYYRLVGRPQKVRSDFEDHLSETQLNCAPSPVQKPLIPKGEPDAKEDCTQALLIIQKKLDPSGVSVPMSEEGTA